MSVRPCRLSRGLIRVEEEERKLESIERERERER